MADQAIGLTQAASIPGSSVFGIAHTDGGVIAIQLRVIGCEFIAKFFCLLIVIKISFSIVLPKTSPGMARPTILDKKERGFINFRGMGIDFLSQLARIGRGESMLSIHSGRKIPGVLGVESVANDDFPSSIRATLLEVVTLCNLLIVMAGPAGLPGTVRDFAIGGERASIESFRNDLLVQRHLGRNKGGVEERENAQGCR